MSKDIETLRLPDGFDEENVNSSFQALLGKASFQQISGSIGPPRLVIYFAMDKCLSEVDGISVEPPKLGPFAEFNECRMERYSRTNAILRSITCSIAPIKWTELWKSSDPLPSVSIHLSSIPVWMRPATGAIENTRLVQVARPRRQLIEVSFNHYTVKRNESLS